MWENYKKKSSINVFFFLKKRKKGVVGIFFFKKRQIKKQYIDLQVPGSQQEVRIKK